MPMKKRTILWLLLLALCFLLALSRLDSGRKEEGRQQLELALRRTAVACYGAEGFYPPNVEYMEEHYGLQYDKDQYLVRYEIFATNLMPGFTVLEVEP